MLAVVVSRADEASVAIGEQLRDLADWQTAVDERRPDGDGGGTVYRAEGVELREFGAPHLDLHRPADAFGDPDLLVVASKHAGDTGPLLTAHHTGNFGPADHGGEDDALARACPSAHARVLDALAEHAPEGYGVGMECTHHGPTEVGAPSMFVEVGSGPTQWADPAAARAVAKAILDLRGVSPDRDPESVDPGADDVGDVADPEDARARRHLVGFGGGHYAPRFERVVRETDWAVGHVAADWGLDAMPDPDTEAGRALLDAAFVRSRASHALVAEDRPAVSRAIADLGYRAVGETWVRETDGVPLALVHRAERAVWPVADGLRFGDRAESWPAVDLAVRTLPADLLETARGIDQPATLAAVRRESIAYATDQGGSRPTETVALPDEDDDGEGAREAILDELADVLDRRYDTVERDGEELLARETAFDPSLAETLGVPEGPKFGRLASGEAVEVGDRTIPPETVRETRVDRFDLR